MDSTDILSVLIGTIDDLATQITDDHVGVNNPSWSKYKAAVVQKMCDDIASRAGMAVGFISAVVYNTDNRRV